MKEKNTTPETNKGFTLTCNTCGATVEINGSESSRLIDLSFSNQDVYIDAFDFANEGTLYANIGCQKCSQNIRGVFVK